MQYEGTIFRPPSEARSLLVQATIGCAWNRCTFCAMYKDKRFRERELEEIVLDLEEAAVYRDRIRRIFLCDGDALAMDAAKLTAVLERIRTLYPGLEGVRVYASARDILRKTPRELARLRELGLDMAYLGLESGSDRVLAQVNKGITREEMVQAAHRLREAGVGLSASIIAGLGGAADWREHITETASALNRMQPQYVGMLVLHLGGEERLMGRVRDGSFRLPSPEQVLAEMQLLLEELRLEDCVFSSAHISNYLDLRGHLPEDRERMVETLRQLRQAAGV